MLGAVVQIDGWDPVAGAAVALTAASHDDAAVCHLNGQVWWPALAKLPVLRYDLFDGAFEGQIVAPSSVCTLRTEPWADFARYALADARIRLWTGEVGDSWSAWTLRFDGRVTAQPKIAGGAAEVAFAVDDRWLDRALLPTYAGTTAVEGPAALKGAAKPLALGAPRYAAGILIDAANSVFQLSFGAIRSVETALERLSRFGVSAGDYASYAALVAATIPPGRWATCLIAGLARFGAPPNGQISFLLEGDNGGPDGWARKPGQIVRRIAQIAGALDKVDSASLDAIDAARPYTLSINLDQQTTGRDLVQRIAASVNAVAVVTWLGKLMLLPVGIGTPTMTLAADGTALPPVASVEQVEVAAPFQRVAIEAARSWTVHALADVAFTAQLVDVGAYDPARTNREGNIVQDQGSSWLYVNPAPTAGNAPPTLPVTENSYWKVLAKAGSDVALVTPKLSANTAGFAADGALRTGAITLDVARQNAAGTTTFTIRTPDGTIHGGTDRTAAQLAADYPSYFATSGADNLVMKAAWLPVVLAPAYGGSFEVTAKAAGVTGKASVTRVDDGLAGADGYGLDVSVAALVVACDYLGNVKAGALPLPFAVKVTKGAAEVTGSATIAFAGSSSGVTVTGSAGSYQLTAIGSGDGYVNVSVSIAGSSFPVRRLPIQKKLDNPPPSSVQSSARSFNANIATTSFDEANGASAYAIITGNGNGIAYSAVAEYRAPFNASQIASITVQGKIQYRSGGGAWVDAGPAVNGSQAVTRPSDGPEAGLIVITGTTPALTSGTNYEFRFIGRIIQQSNASATSITGGTLSVSLT